MGGAQFAPPPIYSTPYDRISCSFLCGHSGVPLFGQDKVQGKGAGLPSLPSRGIFCGMFIGLSRNVFLFCCHLAIDEGGRSYARGDDASDVSARTEGMRRLYCHGYDYEPMPHL